MIAVSVVGVSGPGIIRRQDGVEVYLPGVQKATEFLQLAPDSVLAVPAQFPNDLPRVGHVGPESQEVDSLGQREDRRFLIQFQAKVCDELPDLLKAKLKICLVFVDQIEVVHVTAVELDSQAFLDEVIQP